MNIIGAGLTGCLAACAFKNSVIHEFLPEPKRHRAVLRFRTEEVSELTGIPFKRVTVHKAVSVSGGFVTPNLRLMNQYSQKVTGGYYDRSIGDLSPSVRFVAPIDFHDILLDRLRDRIVCSSPIDLEKLDLPIISTLPLPILLKKLNDDAIAQTAKVAPIFVTTINFKDCDLYQTVYFPDSTTKAYRVSMTGNQMIIESMEPMYTDQIFQVIDVFGLPRTHPDQHNVKQEHGKFVELEESYRQNLMYEITRDHGIYSLGRHATWRKILLDDVVHDLKRIESMIKTSAYDRMLGKMK